MPDLKRSLARLALLAFLAVSATGLWTLHIRAWNPGMHTPLLSYDASQYALAARELAETGRLATTYALPVELVTHPRPPWPLAVVQPGLVLFEAALLKITPTVLRIPGSKPMLLKEPSQRESIVLVLPFICFLGIGVALGLATMNVLRRFAPSTPRTACALAGAAVGLAFLLDPEAQHFGAGGFTELPFTLGLIGATAALALGRAHRQPLLFGVLLGLTGLFRANMLWLVPWFAAGAALTAPGARGRTLVMILAGFVLPLAPWWFYKWSMFGSPGWDLTRYTLWDGIGGRSWFSLYHLPEIPLVPQGLAAVVPLTSKVLGNLPGLLLSLFTGPRALWVGAIVIWLVVVKPRDGVWAAVFVTLGAMVMNLLAAAASIPWMRFLFPSRVLIEAVGLLAVWDLVGRIPEASMSRALRRAVRVGVATLAIGWGGLQTVRGIDEAGAAAETRGVPSTATLNELVEMLDSELAPGETVMSNLGPTLAWRARRPVVHLALTPEDVQAVREVLDIHHVVLAFRSPQHAWRGWDEVIARPAEAPSHPEWNVLRVRQFQSEDGFIVVWLELGPLGPGLAFAR